MNPLFIVYGVYLTAKVVNVIFDILSEDVNRQRKEIDAYLADIDEVINASDEIHRIQLADERRNKLTAWAEERIEDCKKTDVDIREALRTINDLLDERTQQVFLTPIRKDCLQTLSRQISEAKYKNEGYINYLRAYCDSIRENREVNSFVDRIPSQFPYYGKVMWISCKDVKDGKVRYEIPDSNILCEIDIADCGCNQLLNRFPVMISTHVVSGTCFTGSYSYGVFHEYIVTNSSLGIRCSVNSISRSGVELLYNDSIKLFLPFKKLKSYNRCPLVRQDIDVYPLKWDYGLNCYQRSQSAMIVSEKEEDKHVDLGFKTLPIAFSHDGLEEFLNYLNDNNLVDSDEEWLLGPSSQIDPIDNDMTFKLQLGRVPLCLLKLIQYEDKDTQHMIFKYVSLLDDDPFQADDVFVPIDAAIAPCFDDTDYDSICDELGVDSVDVYDTFARNVLEELRVQFRIKQNAHGLSFFTRWEHLLDLLIESSPDESIELELEWDDENLYVASILNAEDIDEFLEERIIRDDIAQHLYIKNRKNNRVPINIEAGKIIIDSVKTTKQGIVAIKKLSSVNVYFSENHYIEVKQKEALQRFRMGDVLNSTISLACFNPNDVAESLDDKANIDAFHNANLLSNESQKNAVIRAFAERNVFAIQGPPGTGKTTVIREIVFQQLQRYPSSSILIVSQSNAAVDNALLGLIEMFGNTIVRCGSDEKMQKELIPYSIDTKYSQYIDLLEKKKSDNESSVFGAWIKTLNSDDNNSKLIKELIVKNYHIVGATCMGLMKRDISLDKSEFDLVIFDEAGKALPAELVIPTLCARKIIYIGDQNQLPPVVDPRLFDPEFEYSNDVVVKDDSLYSESLFERIITSIPESNKSMLTTQYRMPEVIGTIVSQLFYNGELVNGDITIDKRPIYHKSNLVFYDFSEVDGFKESKRDNSIINIKESQFVAALVHRIREEDDNCSIAIVTPYRAQKRLINDSVHYLYNGIKVDTVDGFQGSEADVVIFCTTRTKRKTLFFQDWKRINVALSRTKRELIILGDLSYFKSYSSESCCLPRLADMIEDADKNGRATIVRVHD